MITNVSPKKWLLMSLGAMLLSGCATTSTDPSRQNVGTTVYSFVRRMSFVQWLL
ncbi:hypothetical protein [Acinetobacter johnsonii]|uniref:hypothetical protein n=1 Tax=Acinetobacter johnsonii TaxID=40214 RepID=UPI00393D8D85